MYTRQGMVVQKLTFRKIKRLVSCVICIYGRQTRILQDDLHTMAGKSYSLGESDFGRLFKIIVRPISF